MESIPIQPQSQELKLSQPFELAAMFGFCQDHTGLDRAKNQLKHQGIQAVLKAPN